MGEIKKVLTEIKQLIIETEDILKNKFDCDDYIKSISIDEEREVVVVEDMRNKFFEYDICDAYTSLIKIIKNYKDEGIIHNYKRLKEISLQAEIN